VSLQSQFQWRAPAIFLAGSLFLSVSGKAFQPPATFTPERYAHLWENSPFSAATPQQVTGPGHDWLLTGLSVLNKTPFATLTHKKTRRSLGLAAGESREGLTLIKASLNPDFSESFALIEVNGTEQRLTFDKELLAQFSTRNQPQAQSAAPTNPTAQPAKNKVQIQSKQAPSSPKPPSRRRIILRRN